MFVKILKNELEMMKQLPERQWSRIISELCERNMKKRPAIPTMRK